MQDAVSRDDDVADKARCVICGQLQAESDLTDEHAIPLALGGNIVLKSATCEPCRKTTSRFEAKATRGAMRAFRAKVGLTSKARALPETLPIFVVGEGEEARIDVPFEEYPLLLPLPRFNRAAYLDDGRADSNATVPWHALDFDRADRLLEHYGLNEFASMELDVISFAKLLMKIAHCLAVREFGYKFTPYLLDEISKRENGDYRKYVRSKENPKGELDVVTKHRCAFFNATIQGYELLVCELQLFANLHAPTYQVVVGEMGGDFDAERSFCCDRVEPHELKPKETIRLHYSRRFADPSPLQDGRVGDVILRDFG